MRIRNLIKSLGEAEVRDILEDFCNGRYRCHAGVSLSQVFDPQDPSWTEGERRMIFSSNVDWLVTDDSRKEKPLLAIEVDGPHHKHREQQRKDRTKDRIFAKAGLPLLRHTTEQVGRGLTEREIERWVRTEFLIPELLRHRRFWEAMARSLPGELEPELRKVSGEFVRIFGVHEGHDWFLEGVRVSDEVNRSNRVTAESFLKFPDGTRFRGVGTCLRTDSTEPGWIAVQRSVVDVFNKAIAAYRDGTLVAQAEPKFSPQHPEHPVARLVGLLPGGTDDDLDDATKEFLNDDSLPWRRAVEEYSAKKLAELKRKVGTCQPDVVVTPVEKAERYLDDSETLRVVARLRLRRPSRDSMTIDGIAEIGMEDLSDEEPKHAGDIVVKAKQQDLLFNVAEYDAWKQIASLLGCLGQGKDKDTGDNNPRH